MIHVGDSDNDLPGPDEPVDFDENGDPVEGQLNVVGVVPGDEGCNDFWQVNRVLVPDEYEANTITSASALMDDGYGSETTTTVKNCPVVSVEQTPKTN